MPALTRRELRSAPTTRAAVRKNRKAQVRSRRPRRPRLTFTVGFLPGFSLGFGTGIVYVLILNWGQWINSI